jgi:hypothetical protein
LIGLPRNHHRQPQYGLGFGTGVGCLLRRNPLRHRAADSQYPVGTGFFTWARASAPQRLGRVAWPCALGVITAIILCRCSGSGAAQNMIAKARNFVRKGPKMEQAK